MAEYQQLYRMFDKHDRLLYVGISKSALARFAQHAAEKSWIGEVVRVQVETFECTRASILAKEREAIRCEKPRYNLACKLADDVANDTEIEWPTVAEVVAWYWQKATLIYGLSSLYKHGRLRSWLWPHVYAQRELLRVARNRPTDLLTVADLELVQWNMAKSRTLTCREVRVRMHCIVKLLTDHACSYVPGQVTASLRTFAPIQQGQYGLREMTAEEEKREARQHDLLLRTAAKWC